MKLSWLCSLIVVLLASCCSASATIEPGKLADLVVLSGDIFTIPPEAIEKTRVDMTLFDGNVIYQR